MKGVAYAGALLGVVPLQVTVLQYLAIGEVRPDLCLALTCLVGFVVGERQGLLLGLGLGFMQDLVSAGELWLNVVTKGVAGLVAGMAGRQLVQTTPLSFLILSLSMSSLLGLVFLFAGQPVGALAEELVTLRSILLPQAAYDAVTAVGLYWLLAKRFRSTLPPDQVEAGGTGPVWAMK